MENKEVVVNVEQIMEELRQQILQEHGSIYMPEFDSVPMAGGVVRVNAECYDPKDLAEALQVVTGKFDVPYHWPMEGSKLKILFRKVVRRVIKCAVLPILVGQNEVNAATACSLNQMSLRADEQQAVLEKQQQELTKLQNRQQELEQTIQRLQEQLQAAHSGTEK